MSLSIYVFYSYIYTYIFFQLVWFAVANCAQKLRTPVYIECERKSNSINSILYASFAYAHIYFSYFMFSSCCSHGISAVAVAFFFLSSLHRFFSLHFASLYRELCSGNMCGNSLIKCICIAHSQLQSDANWIKIFHLSAISMFYNRLYLCILSKQEKK